MLLLGEVISKRVCWLIEQKRVLFEEKEESKKDLSDFEARHPLHAVLREKFGTYDNMKL